MDKEQILKASRRENRNQDLAELELVYQAGSCGARVGALVCCVLSLLASVLAQRMLYSPWTIYFSMVAAQWTVRFLKLKKKSDLAVAAAFVILAFLAFVAVVQRLLEVGA